MKIGDWFLKIVLCLGSLCIAGAILVIGLFLSQPTGFFSVLNSDSQKLVGYGLVVIAIFFTFYSFSFLRIDKTDSRSNISAGKFNKFLYIIPTILLAGVFIFVFIMGIKDKAQVSDLPPEDQLFLTR
jgi:hypothetical protein